MLRSFPEQFFSEGRDHEHNEELEKEVEEHHDNFFGCESKEAKTLEEWIKEQNNPSSKFMNFVRSDISSNSMTKFFVKDGLFFIKGEDKKPDRVLVPECFREWVLKMHHNIPLAGHQG